MKCVCGHEADVHAYNPSGNPTNCWDSIDGRVDDYGYPINRCTCGEYQPGETA